MAKLKPRSPRPPVPAARPEKMQPPRKVPFQRRVAVHAAAAESCDLAGRVKPRHRLAVGAQHAAVEIGLQAAERLAGQNIEPNGNQRAGLRIEQPVRLGRANKPVAEIIARGADGHDLHVLAERVVELAIARDDLALDARNDRAKARRRRARSCA